VLSNADMLSLLREHNARAPDQLLLEGFGGKLGRVSPSNCRAAPVLSGYSAIDESLAETRHNGDAQTKVCSQTKGGQSVDVISEVRILGKFFRPTREWPSPGAENALVTKTWAPLLENSLGNALCGEGEVIANAPLCRKKG
jgi:hypothetical protein